MGRSEDSSTREWAKEQSRVEIRLHAHAYIRKGWAVVPLWWPEFPLVCACPLKHECKAPGKHPMKQAWQKDPLLTGIEIDLWWERHPHSNVGLATGAASGFIVLDIDPAHGGWDSYNRIVKKHGKMPNTLVSVTGSGGRHVLFLHPGGGEKIKNAIGYLPGIDVRGDGGQIVAPPSMHGCGLRYSWHPSGHPRDTKIAPMPDWMFTFLELKEQRRRDRNRQAYNGGRNPGVQRSSKYGRVLDLADVPSIAEGHRNDTLCSIVGRLIWENRDEAEILQLAHRVNETRCAPPLPEKEVVRLVRAAVSRWAQ